MKTEHYELPLPHPDADLQDDVAKLRNALKNIDALMFEVEQRLNISYSDRFKWDGSPLANPAAGRASLQLASAATRPASDFATAAQGAAADTALAQSMRWNGGNAGLNAATGRSSLGGTTVGQSFFTTANPSAIRFPRVNANNTVSYLTAAEIIIAIGANTGMVNPMTAAGDLIVGGASGAPTRQAKGGNATIYGVDNGGNLGYLPQSSGVFDFGRYSRARSVTANVTANTTFNIDLEGSAHVSIGASYWCSRNSNKGTHPVWPGAIGILYRLDDSKILDASTAARSGRYQIAIPHADNETERDALFLQIRFKLHETVSNAQSWGPWKPLGGGGSTASAPVQRFSRNDEVNNSITANCDCSAANFHMLDFWGSPAPTANGSYTINLTNLPAATDVVISGHIQVRGAGRKNPVLIQANGLTSNWLAAPSFQPSGVDLISYYVTPLQPSELLLSVVDGRA